MKKLQSIMSEAEARDYKRLLELTIVNDTNYAYRERLVYHLLHYAGLAGFECGIRIDPNEPEWPVVYIELPTGQVSWHMPQHEKEFDGHSTEEKFERIKRFIES